jgi:hypothetical protein
MLSHISTPSSSREPHGYKILNANQFLESSVDTTYKLIMTTFWLKAKYLVLFLNQNTLFVQLVNCIYCLEI